MQESINYRLNIRNLICFAQQFSKEDAYCIYKLTDIKRFEAAFKKLQDETVIKIFMACCRFFR